MSRTRFGAIVFDNPELAETGWVSIEGDQAKKIVSQAELPSDAILWSNLTFNACTTTYRNRLVQSIRPDSYIPFRRDVILKEWDRNITLISPERHVELAAGIFDNIMSMSRGLIRAIDPSRRDDNFFTGQKIVDDLSCILPPPEFPEAGSEMNSILQRGQAFEDYTNTTLFKKHDVPIVTVFRPRIEHAIDILSSPVPNGPFSSYYGRILPSAGDLAIAERPVIAEIAVNGSQPEMGSIYGFGVSGRYGDKMPRQWVTHPELAVMTRFTDIEIRTAFVGSSYSIMSQSLAGKLREFLLNSQTALSWSAGALAGCIWRAATVGQPFKSSKIKSKRPATSWRGSWLLGMDKILTMEYAMRLYREGFPVSGYGKGAVSCAVPKERHEEFILCAWKHGMIPMMLDIERGFTDAALAITPWGGDPASKYLASLTMQKNIEALWDLDALPLASQEEKIAILKRVQQVISRA